MQLSSFEPGKSDRPLRENVELISRHQPRIFRGRSQSRFPEQRRDLWRTDPFVARADCGERFRGDPPLPRAAVVLIPRGHTTPKRRKFHYREAKRIYAGSLLDGCSPQRRRREKAETPN